MNSEPLLPTSQEGKPSVRLCQRGDLCNSVSDVLFFEARAVDAFYPGQVCWCIRSGLVISALEFRSGG